MLVIHEPYWGKRAFGVSKSYLTGDFVEVRCDYKKADGSLAYPETYQMRCNKVKMYPTKIAKGVTLYIVPIADFEIKGEPDA